MGDPTKLLKMRADGRYDVIHVSIGGYPSHVGRHLLDHVGTYDEVERLFLIADECDSRMIEKLPDRRVEADDFTRGERRLAMDPFPSDDILSVMAGYSFFLFHDGAWLWMGDPEVTMMSEAFKWKTPLKRDHVIGMCKPLTEAVEDHERPLREAEMARRTAVEEASGEVGIQGFTTDLVESEDGWSIALGKDGVEIARMGIEESMRLITNMEILADEALMRRLDTMRTKRTKQE
jgi:hypothetical protein